MNLLGVFGPLQLIVVVILGGGIITGIVFLILYLTKNNSSSPIVPTGNTIDSLERLNELFKSGALSKEEFEAGKKKLLQ
ncbi:MAG: hypothetical protein ACI837_001100 [Crocinitomicaceae bacterium]|jgi:hypothetical protein